MAEQKKIIILFPNQLFSDEDAIKQATHVVMIEDPRFFLDFNFCKNKLILHRASMQAYKYYLEQKGKIVKYFDFQSATVPGFLEEFLSNKKQDQITVYEPEDFAIERLIDNIADRKSFDINILESPLFITDKERVFELFADKRKYSMKKFYINQRKHYGILVENQKPVGGKWSFDIENRKPFDKKIKVSRLKSFKNSYVEEAKQYVNDYFPDNPGRDDNFIFPVTYSEAWRWFEYFLEDKFRYFGDYEDAIVKDEPFLFHSMMSSSLNIGLLTPNMVLCMASDYARKHDIPLNSLEGYVRQILGWREYVRAVHVFKDKVIRQKNFWKFKKKMPKAFYTANTGIEPVDNTIKKVLKYGYIHHIERLMVMGTFMLLCEIHADWVYVWFMELFVDSYDWVMVPNVYGMCQYSAGDIMTTKPYLSSSNYILKMSDYQKGPWCDIWDSLYWSFLDKHRIKFEKNPRIKVMLYNLDRKTPEQMEQYHNTAANYLKELYKR